MVREILEWWDDLFREEKTIFMFAGFVTFTLVSVTIWLTWMIVGPWSLAVIAMVVVGFRALYRYVWGD